MPVEGAVTGGVDQDVGARSMFVIAPPQGNDFGLWQYDPSAPAPTE
jgi:hypothetical protein